MSKLIKAWNNTTYTENAALTHKNSLNPLLDLFAMGAAARSRDITHLFSAAHEQDRVRAIKCLFYMRDVRKGQGERSTFRSLLRWLYNNDRAGFYAVAPFIPEYGRWDDLTEYVDDDRIVAFIIEQLNDDIESDHPSLLAKWMPSENASSKETRSLARKWVAKLGITVTQYRKHLLSPLRKKISLVESAMSSREWRSINYERVPSKAMLNYRRAFSKHDPDGFVAYLEGVKKGEKKINSGVLYPYEIYERYQQVRYGSVDDTLEEQWKALPNYMNDASVLVMADVSGSMTGRPMAVSVSLAIYAAERSTGAFAGYYMSFSDHPVLVKVHGNNLREIMRNVEHEHVGYNTNVQRGFELILETAKRNHIEQSDLPHIIMIISDMEFDSCGGRETNFEAIDRKFAAAGYTRPTLVFWNVDSRHDNIPVTEKEPGVYLVSGCSPSILKNALNTTAIMPVDLMLEVLDGERYQPLEEAL